MAAAINESLTFQGRLRTASQGIVPDGEYNLQFKIYEGGTESSGGTNTWTESYTGTDQVRVENGYFNVHLGSITSLSGVDFTNDTLWLTMNVGGTSGTPSYDGEMTPRIRLTSTPYAFEAKNADQLDNIDSSQFARTDQNETFNNTVTIQGVTTIGTSSSLGQLQLNDGSNHTGTIQTSALGQDTTYTLPDPGQATADICLTTGNCAGSGGGITGSGTTDQVAYFDGSGSITSSANLLFDGTDLALTGTLTANAFSGDGANLTNLNASNISSGTLANARLNASVSLLGQSIQDGEVDNDLTVSSAGSVADGALSSNVSLLGQSIASGEITNNTITNADIAGDTIGATELATGSVGSDEIASGSVQEIDLYATNSATNNYVLSYDSGSGGFTWIDQGSLDSAGVDSLNTLTGDVSIQGNSQVGVSVSGQNVDLSIQGDSIGNTQLVYDTGQHLTTSSNVVFSTLTLGSGDDVLVFDGGDSQINTHDGFGNFNFKSGVDGNNVITSVAGGSHLRLDETGAIYLNVDESTTVGNTFSNELGIQLNNGSISFTGAFDASNVNAGTLNDARLSSNVSLLGQTIEGGEITDNTIALGTKTTGDYVSTLATNTTLTGSGSGEGSTPTLGLNLGSANTWTALQTHNNGLRVSGGRVNLINRSILEGGPAGATRVYRNLANFEGNSNTDAGAIVITTDVTPSNQMSVVSLKGYKYSATGAGGAGHNVDLDINSYWNSNGTSWTNRSYTNKGDVDFDQVRIGTDSSGKVVIVLGDTADTWSYLKLWVEKWISSHSSSSDGEGDNWSIGFSTDLSGYTLTSVGNDSHLIDDTRFVNKAGDTMTGALTVQSTLTANSFSGNGANLTSLNASNVSSGTLANARLSANVSLLGQSISKDELANAGTLGFDWTDSEITDALTVGSTGSVADGALSANVSLLGQSISSAEIINNTIGEVDLNVSNSPTSGYVLTSDGSGGFTWASPGSIGGGLWSQSGSDVYYNSGNVGIGTSSPIRKLDVRGEALFRTDNTSYDIWIQGGTGSGDDRNLAFLGRDEDSGDELIINFGGEYASGVTVESNLTALGNARGAYNMSEYVEIGHGGAHGYVNKVGSGNLDFRIGGNNVFRINTGGNGSRLMGSESNDFYEIDGTNEWHQWYTNNTEKLRLQQGALWLRGGSHLVLENTPTLAGGVGDFYAYWDDDHTNGWRIGTTQGSSERYKDDITEQQLFDPEAFLQLPIKQWNWNPDKLEAAGYEPTEGFGYGFTAEDLYGAAGETFVQLDDEGKPFRPKNARFIWGAIAGLQHVNSDLQSFKSSTNARITDLQTQIDQHAAANYLQNGDSVRFTSLNVSGNTTLNGRLTVKNNATFAKDVLVGGKLTVEEVEVASDLYVNGEVLASTYASEGDLPEIQPLSALGEETTEGLTPTAEVEGNDAAGTIHFMATESPEPGQAVELTFTQAYEKMPRIVLQPLNEVSSKLDFFVERTEEGFVLRTTSTIMDEEEYTFDYQVISASTVSAE